jgi:RNA polymerase sigma-70 factor (ECF subfamily)
MRDSPDTRRSLLMRIRDAQDKQAWAEFVGVYAPLIHGFARKRGLQEADAANVTQDVLLKVHKSGRNYDPERGSFRAWLFSVVRNQLFNMLDSQKRPGQGSGDTNQQEVLAQQPARDEDQMAQWDQEHERRLYHCAAEKVREQVEDNTWTAFLQTAVEGKKAEVVAHTLGMTPAAVRLAKSRVMARLHAEIRRLEEE